MIIKTLFSTALNIGNKNSIVSKTLLKSCPAILSTTQDTNPSYNIMSKCKFSTTQKRFDLSEFFESKLNISEETIKHGRPWRIEELRIKSNSDLHKLWYVLHKERNMLLTMEDMYKKNGEAMPNPERICKVDESMENILGVVDERNIAYNLLETGESKQLISFNRYNSFGHLQKYKPREHLVPWWLNKTWKLKYHYKKLPYWSKHYRTLFRVQLNRERAKISRRVMYALKRLSHKHPNMDEAFVKQHFEKKYGYTAPLPYSELIKRPKPSDVPVHITDRQRFKNAGDDFQ